MVIIMWKECCVANACSMGMFYFYNYIILATMPGLYCMPPITSEIMNCAQLSKIENYFMYCINIINTDCMRWVCNWAENTSETWCWLKQLEVNSIFLICSQHAKLPLKLILSCWWWQRTNIRYDEYYLIYKQW